MKKVYSFNHRILPQIRPHATTPSLTAFTHSIRVFILSFLVCRLSFTGFANTDKICSLGKK